jgi:hypothetical protein
MCSPAFSTFWKTSVVADKPFSVRLLACTYKIAEQLFGHAIFTPSCKVETKKNLQIQWYYKRQFATTGSIRNLKE